MSAAPHSHRSRIHRVGSTLNTDSLPIARSIEEQLIVAAFARLRAVPLGVSLGLVCGLGLFAATAVLLVKAALASTGLPVGSHLRLLGEYFPGYTVTWPGSLVGFFYGLATGFLLGVASAALVNFNHLLYMRLLRRRLRRRAFHDGL